MSQADAGRWLATIGAMTLASLLDAELAFGLHPLLDCASLTVVEGDRIGLIGRNGTGKSSLLNVIAGRIELDGGVIKRRDGLGIALVEQEPALPPASTLRESLAARGHFEQLADDRERWRIEAKLIEQLHRFGLDEARDPSALSGGERKRGALALAFALGPELLLLDEPTNHLDLRHQVWIMGMIRALSVQSEGAAIAALHDVNLAARYCSHVLMLYGNGEWTAGPIAHLLNEANLDRLYGCTVRKLDSPDGPCFYPLAH